MRLPFVSLVTLLLAFPARADEARGPLAPRDTQLFAQPRLVLAPEGARTLGRGRTLLRAGLHWGNSFAWAQDAPGETPSLRRYLLDGEALTLDFELRRGLTDALDVGLRLPLHWRGGGALDGIIDAFHRVFRFAGVGDGSRPAFVRDAFRVEGRTRDGTPFTWSDARGAGLGDAELSARLALGGAGTRRSLGLALHVSLPTGTRPFDGGAASAGVQLLAARDLGARADLHFGVGATFGGARQVRGVSYERERVQGFAVVERRLGARVSLLLGSEIASPLMRAQGGFAGLHWTAHAGAWFDLSHRARLGVALVENIAAQASTADLALHLGVELRR